MSNREFPSTVPGDTALVLRAVNFAAERHREQVRKYTGEPYLHHLLAVAQGVAMRTMDPHVIAAAVLHDILEDTETTPEEIGQFSIRTAALVVELTDVYTFKAYPHINRAERKNREAHRFYETSAEAQLIKAYDLLDNTRTIVEHDLSFAKVYLAEKRNLFNVMTKLDPHEKILLDGSLRRAEQCLKT